MDDLAQAAARLATLAKSPLNFTPKFAPLEASAMPGCTIAVDASAAVLADNGSVWVAAVRAEALAWPGPKPAEPQARIVAASRTEARALLETEYSAAGFDAPHAAGAEAWAGALQALAEWQAAMRAMAVRPNLVLIDGALRGLPRHAQFMADALIQAADTAGVSLVAVAKRSGLGDTLVPALMAAGPAKPWLVDVPGEVGVFVAKLHTQAAHAFRVDALAPRDVAALVPMCRDAGYLGYPYPLAVVHNRVAFTAGRVQELQARLDRELRLHGESAARMVADFHAVLDRNVPG